MEYKDIYYVIANINNYYYSYFNNRNEYGDHYMFNWDIYSAVRFSSKVEAHKLIKKGLHRNTFYYGDLVNLKIVECTFSIRDIKIKV